VAAAAAALLVLRLVLGGAPIAPRAEGFASLDPLLARLPDWADVLHGLGHWVQRIVA
jgi:hypothetical protein